ncbi:ABC transporter substrate-binding protein [Saccharomonospora sp. NPDC046836]|uniref:ABC transporter substrate-binding protein n=1 Tax=Saccharomonospora sp. NPDC046836 TaxID=3156921 RepID=UPI0033CD6176
MYTPNRRAFLRNSVRAAAVVGAGAGLTGMLASCGSPGAASSGSDPKAITLQSAWINDAEFMGYYIAKDEGYYQRAGIDFTYLSGGPSVIPESTLLAGRADVALTTPDTTIKAIAEQNAPFVIIGAQYQKNPLGVVSLEGNGITKPQDLVGKRLAVPDVNRLAVEAMFKINDIPVDDVRIVPYAYDPTPLLKGEVDATVDFTVNIPYTIRQAGGEPTSFLLYDVGFKIFNDTVVVTRDVLQNKRETLVAWLRASREGWQRNFADPTAFPPRYADSWFKGTGRTIDNEIYFNEHSKPLIEAGGGVFAMSEQAIADCVDSLKQLGLAATPEMFDASLIAEL